MLSALAGIAQRRGRLVVVAAVLLAAGAILVGAGVAERLDPSGADDPAAESTRAADRMEAADAESNEPTLLVVVESRGGDYVRSAAARRDLDDLAASIRRDRDVARVLTPFN